MILVVEDDNALRETIVYNLARQEYEVHAVGDGIAALETARKIQPDLLLLDLMLPGLDGIEVCRILRQEMNIPIIMLTARDDEIDRLIGLEIGADDYIKPFSMRDEAGSPTCAMTGRFRSQHNGANDRPWNLDFDNLSIDTPRRAYC
jgi:DNA-binding response OmpR family regulator